MTVTQRAVVVTPIGPNGEPLQEFTGIVDEVDQQGVFVRTSKQLPEHTLVLLDIKLRRQEMLEAVVVHSIPGAGFGCRFP
jgi:hypothetical protein